MKSGANRTGSAKQLGRLELDLADVARRILVLLNQERYDEAELAELDARRDGLRERINAMKAPERGALDVYHGTSPVSRE